MVVADSATAARFNLPMVKLQNASGNFVSPTPATLAAGLAAMKKTSTAGVLAPDPERQGRQRLPADVPSATPRPFPAGLNAASRAAYAAFIKYAVGAGQVPGDQPGELPGRVPAVAEGDEGRRRRRAAARIGKLQARGEPPPSRRLDRSPTRGARARPGPHPGSGTRRPFRPTTGSDPCRRPDGTDWSPSPTPTPVSPAARRRSAGATPVTPTGPADKALLWLVLIFGLAVVGTPGPAPPAPDPPRRRRAPAYLHRAAPDPRGRPSGAPSPPGGDAGA